jgi:hypothetical protein
LTFFTREERKMEKQIRDEKKERIEIMEIKFLDEITRSSCMLPSLVCTVESATDICIF